MIEILISSFAVIIVFLTSLCLVIQVKDFIRLRKIPGPTPLPLVGNALELVSLAENLPKLLEYKKKYGDIFRLFIGFNQPQVYVAGHSFLAYILNSPKLIDKGDVYKFLHNWLGNGLITSTGSKWKKHRKLITPAFHFHILEKSIETFESNTELLLSKLQQYEGGESFDIYPYISLCTLDAVCESAMGLQINAQKDPTSEYVDSTQNMLKIIRERTFSAFKRYDMLYSFSDTYKREKQALKIIHSTASSVINKRKLEGTKLNSVQEKHDDIGLKKKRAFLDILLQSTLDDEPLPENDIREEVDTFMFAGYETTASTISYTLYNLSKYPEIQKRVVEELYNIFRNDKFRRTTFEDLRKMKYLEAVIKETLRLYPALPVIGRCLTEDVEFDGVVYPKGLTVMLFICGIQRDPRYFPDPEKFDPNRFLDESVTKEFPFAYLPFSAGPRNCIGQKYGMLEVKSVVSHILKHYDILPAVPHHEPILSLEGFLRSMNGLFIRIKKRINK